MGLSQYIIMLMPPQSAFYVEMMGLITTICVDKMWTKAKTEQKKTPEL